MSFIKINGFKKYTLILFLLLFSFTLSTNAAHSAETTKKLSWMDLILAEVTPWSIISAGGGIIADTLSAQAHDAINKKYFLMILAAIEKVNLKLDLIIQNSCYIYEHSIYADYKAFTVAYKQYLAVAPEFRYKDFNTLHDLSLYLPAILSKFEDHNDRLALCPSLSQFDTMGLYLLLSNIDLTIQAEHVRQTTYLALAKDKITGLQIPLNQIDVVLRKQMDDVIIPETKKRLVIRLNEVITHLKVLDGTLPSGSASAFSWRKASDQRFKLLYSPSYDLGFNSTIGSFSFDAKNMGVFRVEAPRTNLGENPNSPYGLLVVENNFMTLNPAKYVSFFSNPSYTSFSNNFSYMNIPNVFNYYEANLGLFYPRHKHHKYIELVKSELVPTVKLVNQWIKEVGNPSLTEVPPLTSTTDVKNYYPDTLDASYHYPNVKYTEPLFVLWGPTTPILTF